MRAFDKIKSSSFATNYLPRRPGEDELKKKDIYIVNALVKIGCIM